MDRCGHERLAPILRLGLVALVFASSPGADSFDKPLKKQVMDFGLSANNPPGGKNFRVKLHCYFYPNFMIKEYDNEGEKGAEWVAIVPITNGAAPTCVRTNSAGDRILKYPEWHGYFNGVKGNLVFLNNDDGVDGGMPFTVYDVVTGNKIFEDSAYDSEMHTPKPHPSPFNHIRFSGNRDSDLKMTYLRVVEADCDLHSEKAACWDQVRKKFDLEDAAMPVCTSYKNVSDREVSAVAYPVEVSLFPRPVTKTIAGPVECWPVD